MAYQASGIIAPDVNAFNQEQNRGPERLFEILEEAVIKPDEVALMTEEELKEELKRKQEVVDQAWAKVRDWMWENESEEQRATAAYVRGNGEVTPLHLMCKLNDPPSESVNDLIEAAPEVAGFADVHGWLPLHHACANGASTEVLQILINAYPESKLIQDNQNRTPLHFYATRNKDQPQAMVRNVRLLADSGAAELADRGGMLPMHYACAYGNSADVLKVLADAFPESLSTRDNKGKTPMHLTMANAHRDASPEVLKFLFEIAGKETVNLRDTEGNLPLHLLNSGLKGVDFDKEPEKLNNVCECLKIYFATKPRPSADFLAEVQNLPEELQDVAVISPHVRDILNLKIVRRFPTAIILCDIFAYIALIVCFEVCSTYHIRARFQIERCEFLLDPETGEAWPVETEWEMISRYTVLAASAYLLLREFFQLFSLIALGLGIGTWINDLENWGDVIVFAVPATFAVMMLEYDVYEAEAVECGGSPDDCPGGCDPWGLDPATFRGGCACIKMILWAILVFYLKSLSINFAVFIDGLFFVVRRLVAFTTAVMCILVAFAMMFFILYQQEDMCDPEGVYANLENATNGTLNETNSCENPPTFPHCDPWLSILKVYTMMMGEIGDETRYDGIIAAQILYIFYAFIVVILLSNVLIAIVTDSWEFIQNDRAAIVFWSNRLDFVAEMDGISSLVKQKLCCRTKSKGAAGAPTRVQETPTGTRILDEADEEVSRRQGCFRTAWDSITIGLFVDNVLDDDQQRITSCDFWVFLLYKAVSLFVVIPIWLIFGLATLGTLWPPQVREYILLQGEGGESSQSREKQKLEQLKEIQSDIAILKSDIQKEITADRSDMARMRQDVENVQNEVLSDLQQIKELMTTLLDLGGMQM